MKRISLFLCALCAITAVASAKTLVAYYSYTGDCEAIVNELCKQITADVVRIEPVNLSPADYSAVIIVTPLWWSQMAAIMQSYLFQVGSELAGKKIGLIVSSASSGISGVVADCKRLVPDADYCPENLWIHDSNRSSTSTLIAGWVTANQLNQTQTTSMQINIIVGGTTFPATLTDNETGRAFARLLPLTLQMTELNGNEKYHYLDSSLPTDTYRPGTIQAGDLMLYGSDCIVLFYKTFSSTYSYTRIGAVNNPSSLAQALGSGNVSVRFEAVSTATELLSSPMQTQQQGQLVFRDGQIFVTHNGQTYTLTGAAKQ